MPMWSPENFSCFFFKDKAPTGLRNSKATLRFCVSSCSTPVPDLGFQPPPPFPRAPPPPSPGRRRLQPHLRRRCLQPQHRRCGFLSPRPRPPPTSSTSSPPPSSTPLLRFPFPTAAAPSLPTAAVAPIIFCPPPPLLYPIANQATMRVVVAVPHP
ncbi:hypothetical protein BRADI_4g23742v3 [Brachypodium distachyon]|uniref:Uncharacterized protein n=1 Tax=Brachypodium distachyon TaxID=15368 RepID=A0A0Q3ENQ0_BRADI|nr:hypothetical protein BRADI_4g23742v3 [Brachypodium distachyon]PNT64040.1 hypothetical protein BRADI_4g23742v3 [Brachypodium distachyon]